MEIAEITKRISEEVGVRRLPVPELTNMPNAVKMFCTIANEFMKKKNKQFDLEAVKEQVDYLIRWAYMIGDDIDFNKGILLKGHTGRGKTFLFRVFNYFTKIDQLSYMENGKRWSMNFKIVNVKQIAGEYQSEDGGYTVIRRYAGYRCLVLDDIGKEQEESSNFGNKMNVVEEIINIREELGMLTFATTNLDKMSSMYDDRTVSRMNLLFNVVPINHQIDFRL